MVRTAAASAWLGAAATALGQAAFTGVGDLPGGSFFSNAWAVSGDGQVVVGWSNSTQGTTGVNQCCEAFRWTSGAGIQGLGDLPLGPFESIANGVSGDGSVIVGRGHVGVNIAFRWAGGTMLPLPELPGGGIGGARADAVSGDGRVIVGSDQAANGREAFRIIDAGTPLGLGDLPGGIFRSEAVGVSADGAVIVGWSDSEPGTQAFRWTPSGGMAGLGDLPGGSYRSEALAVSDDGLVIVGRSASTSGLEAFRWTEPGGIQGLGELPGGPFRSEAVAASADGAVIGGVSEGPDGPEAVLWIGGQPARTVRSILVQAGVALGTWTLRACHGVSDDGRVVVGIGTNPSGDSEGWVAMLPPPCYPDCNGDGSLNLADFGCFQSKFALQDPYADCNGDGVLNLADFGCFQTKFALGCP